MSTSPPSWGEAGKGTSAASFDTGGGRARVEGGGVAPDFCLLHQPWLPVRRQNGALEEISLLDAVQSARDYRALEHQDPLVIIALYRLLLAYLHRALDGPDSVETVAAWYRNGFPRESLDGYARKWEGRFYLFHAERPFLQTPELTDARFEDAWTNLSAATGGKNTNFLFRESLRGYDRPTGSIRPAEAARLMVAHQTFALGGFIWRLRNSVQAAPNARSALTMVVGADLHESLCLNLVPHLPGFAAPWEEPAPGLASLEKNEPRPIGAPCQGYAWPARSILLKRDSEGLVAKVGYAAGVPHQEGYHDPMQALSHDFRGAQAALRVRGDQEVWTITPLLVPAEGGGHPAVIEHAKKLLDLLSHEMGALRVDLFGMECDKSKILDIRHERLTVPVRQTREQVEKWRQSAQASLDDAWAAARPIHRGRKPSKATWQRLERSYWQALSRPFERLINSASSGHPHEQEWRDSIARESQRVREQSMSGLGYPESTAAVAEATQRSRDYVACMTRTPFWSRTAATPSQQLIARLMPVGASGRGRASLISALKRLARDTDSQTIERRLFLTLDLPLGEALEEIARLVRRAKETGPLDWARLLDDLEGWTEPGTPVQRRWAQEFALSERWRPRCRLS